MDPLLHTPFWDSKPHVKAYVYSVCIYNSNQKKEWKTIYNISIYCVVY